MSGYANADNIQVINDQWSYEIKQVMRGIQWEEIDTILG